ncbi:MAG: exonuclease domain-containing protein [Acidimicrobiia bacterium]
MSFTDLHPLAPEDRSARIDAAAVARFWGQARIVVVDVETITNDNDLHAVSVATVIGRAGLVRNAWQTLLNPGLPIDEGSARVHGLTDEHLAGEPSFADVAHIIRGALTPAEDELLIFVAHNAAFDANVLRAEFDRIGETIPELPILDTCRQLPSLARVTPPEDNLRSLCDALDITQARPHDALDDAIVCAQAAVELLNRIAVTRDDTLADLIEQLAGPTTLTVRDLDARIFRRRPQAPSLPDEHQQGHMTLLGTRAGSKMLAAWREQVADCARLRCRHLDDRVANAGPAPAKLIAELEGVLDDCCNSGDTAGAATVIGALTPLLPQLPPRPGRLGQRRALIAWASSWAPRLDALGRCGPRHRCPACRSGEPCPLDTWPSAAARAALGDPAQFASGFFKTTGRQAGTGVYTQWCSAGLTRLADEALLVCATHWRRSGQTARADQLFQLAWAAGSRHPDVADAYAGRLAATGREEDLRAALAVAKLARRQRAGSTHEGWRRLQARSHQLAGQLRRRKQRPSGLFDADGNPIPLRRHHPETPRRVRPMRFSRTWAPKDSTATVPEQSAPYAQNASEGG